jgi:hypothetical protein
MPNSTNVCVWVKIAYTHHMCKFDFRMNTTMEDLINTIKKEAFERFDPFIDPTPDKSLFNDVLVIEAGQYNNINGPQPEVAPPMEPSSITIQEKYEGKYDQIIFYINPIKR